MYFNLHANNRRMLETLIQPGDTCVDATAGRGYDTLFMAEKVGPHGNVFAFDVQKKALVSVHERLVSMQMADRVMLVHESHDNMFRYVPFPVRLVMFNFGYLPGGDHTWRTQTHTSLAGCEQGLSLLDVGGILSLILYQDGDEGKAEYAALQNWARELDANQYAVLEMTLSNMPNQPPLQIFVERLR